MMKQVVLKKKVGTREEGLNEGQLAYICCKTLCAICPVVLQIELLTL